MSLSRNLGTLTSWNTLGPSGPLTGLLYLYMSLKKEAYGKALVRYKFHHNHVSVVLYIGALLLLALEQQIMLAIYHVLT